MKRSLPLLMPLLLLTSAPCHANDDFERHVRPVLAERCLKCHGPAKQSGGLRLDSRRAILAGGDSGPAVLLEKPDESLLLKALSHRDELRMPPAGKLPDGDVARLRAWVRAGLPWPPGRSGLTTPATGGDDRLRWWAYQPVRAVRPPAVRNPSWAHNDIDRFVLARLEREGLEPSAEADRRTLIRRVTFDLTGLPPAPEQVDDFVADPRPDAYDRLVERLLASPHHGERWGRHWLDVVRYADTAGENSDHPVPHAWRYRNWVIDAVNIDRPYNEFVREQVAGDLLAPPADPSQQAARVVATGFLAVARRFGHDTDKDMHLTLEDVIDTLGRAVLGQSIACARCHDHKYDPITAKDYYALLGILQSTRFPFPGCEPKQQPRDLVPLVPTAEWARLTAPYRQRLDALEAEARGAEAERQAAARALAGKPHPLAKGEIPDGGRQEFAGTGGAPLEPVEVQPGQVLRLAVSPLGNHGADSTRVEWEITEVGGAGRRWSLAGDILDDLLASNPHADRHGNAGVWWFLDGQDGTTLLAEAVRGVGGKPGLDAWRNGDTPSVFANPGDKPLTVWTTLPPRSVFVHPGARGPVAVAWVSPFAGRVRVSGRISDAHPGGTDGVGWTLDRLPAEVGPGMKRLLAVRDRQKDLARRRAELAAGAPRQELAYAVAEGTPADARIHLRGDPEKLGPAVPRRWLGFLGGQPVNPGGTSGRLQLANWLTDPLAPLTARVMVNRVWLHHFGQGLVATPNDFGTRGLPPSHPELLDWLAARFVQDGWSVKALHRLIVRSAAYRQSSAARPGPQATDPNNTWLWRYSRRRLSAEELRDALLEASGALDRSPAGPHPFPAESTWNFSQHVPFSAVYETDRRSVYLVTLRNRRHPFLGLFDGADPNASTPARQVTTVPTQALYFLNDPFFHAQAERLANRLPAGPPDVRLAALFRVVFQRAPTAQDRAAGESFLARYTAALDGVAPADRPRLAWSALTRVLLASNEFLFVE